MTTDRRPDDDDRDRRGDPDPGARRRPLLAGPGPRRRRRAGGRVPRRLRRQGHPSTSRAIDDVPTPSTSPDAISVAWTEVPLDPATFDGALVGLVVSGPRGVLALGQGRTDRHPIAWSSADGLTWVRTDLPPATFGGGVPDAAVRISSGWVALGYHATADGTTRDIWTSPDGVAWTRDPSATGRGFERVDALTASGQTAVLVATLPGGRQLLLSSRDGQVWAETPDLDATLGRNSTIADVAAAGERVSLPLALQGRSTRSGDPPTGATGRGAPHSTQACPRRPTSPMSSVRPRACSSRVREPFQQQCVLLDLESTDLPGRRARCRQRDSAACAPCSRWTAATWASPETDSRTRAMPSPGRAKSFRTPCPLRPSRRSIGAARGRS